MKYISEFRDRQTALHLAREIKQAAQPGREYNLMEFCGGHTHAIHRYGILDLLPSNIRMIHGPGCPVCVLPISRIDKAIYLAKQPHVILCCYADVMRVPGSNQISLLHCKAKGHDIRDIYSVEEVIDIAKAHPEKEVVFFAIGFETTTPPTAVALLTAEKNDIDNFSIYCNHVLTPVAMRAILGDASHHIDGFIGPSHVSIVIGTDAYQSITQDYQKPIVIAGFEALDVMYSILLLIKLLNKGENIIVNQYRRAVNQHGNTKAQALMQQVFSIRKTFEWRGLGEVNNSALMLHSDYEDYDAENRFLIPDIPGIEHKHCECPAIIRGQKSPHECKLFAKACTPDNPLGACMVSSEGACAAYYAYGRVHRRYHNLKSVS